jgi:hypothetical protein
LLAKATDSLSERPSAEPPAEPSQARRRRLLVLVLPLILLVGLQTTLAFREPIFSPIDELQHTGYVRTIAMQAQLPVYGENENDPTLVSLYYQKSAWGVPRLAPARLNYEALQFPLFYLLAAPIYKLLAADPRAAQRAAVGPGAGASGGLAPARLPARPAAGDGHRAAAGADSRLDPAQQPGDQ